MQKKTFDRLRDIVYETSGISLSERKEALVSARVSKRIRALGLGGFDEYLTYLEKDRGEVVGLLDAVSTNVTSFFREPHHFEYFAEAISDLYASGQRRFRVWSAACSTGEEPLSIAMVMKEALPFPDADMRVLATDISTRTLAHCESGLYPEEKMAPVPADLRERWFDSVILGGECYWRARPALSERVLFCRLNLSAPPFPMKGPLDAVFCRNVMIYFDDSVRMRLLDEIAGLLSPGGLLFVGHAESLAGMISGFKYVRPSIYRKA